METSIHVRARLGVNSCLSLMASYTNCWSCDSDYRGLKKRITAIRQDKESSTGKYVNVSSESEPDTFSGRAGPSAERQRVVNTRDDQIELKDLNRKADGSSGLEVNLTYLFFCASSNFLLKVTTSGLTSLDTHSATRTPTVLGQDTVSPVAPEIQPSPLSPRRPRLREGLRKRSTGQCGYVPLLLSRPV